MQFLRRRRKSKRLNAAPSSTQEKKRSKKETADEQDTQSMNDLDSQGTTSYSVSMDSTAANGVLSSSLPDDDTLEQMEDFEYEERVKALDKTLQTSSLDQDTLLMAKNEEERDTETMIKILVGDPSQWCSDSDEATAFRQRMKNLRELRAMRSERASQEKAEGTSEPKREDRLPCFIVNEELAEDVSSKLFTINYKNLSKTVKFDANKTADELIDLAAKKFSAPDEEELDPKEWVFKATGYVEFMYGTEPMIKFDYIQNCLKKGKQFIPLNLALESEVMEEMKDREELQEAIAYDEGSNQLVYNHNEITIDSCSWNQIKFISMWDLKHHPFRVKIAGVDGIRRTQELVENCPEVLTGNVLIFAVAQVYHGAEPLVPARFTKTIRYNKNIRWDQWLEFDDFEFWNLPRAARLCLTVFARPLRKANDVITSEASLRKGGGRTQFRNSLRLPQGFNLTASEVSDVYGSSLSLTSRDVPIGWVNLQLIDHKGLVKTGSTSKRMWLNERANPIGTTVENLEEKKAPTITVELEDFNIPVVMPYGEPPLSEDEQTFFSKKETAEWAQIEMQTGKEEMKQLMDNAIISDPLVTFNKTQKQLLWLNRENFQDDPRALPKVLQCVDWTEPLAVYQMHKLLDNWALMEPIDALELLGSNFADAKAREYAVLRLNGLPDADLSDIMLQLTQALKYEQYHDSPLARFLLRRAVRNPGIIGHGFYWYLKAEMDAPHIRERYGLLLEEYVLSIGSLRKELFKEISIVNQLLSIAMQIKHVKKTEHREALQRDLNRLMLPSKFRLPLSYRLEASGINIEKCRVMSSKKLPLWLSFQNADQKAGTVEILFKSGDDLRQDILTLQILGVMDKLWKKEGLDLHMNAYGCVATGASVGMLEIVLNSETVGNITKQYGGALSTLSSDEPLFDWLKRQNPEEDSWQKAKENFIYSCAGYCVATYVLGIGDRHNDNIMISKTGNLFHIDFGHFLGHYKKKLGVKRETTPFVFTPMYAKIMGGQESDDFRQFEELCAKAFNILRKNGFMIINLFQLMLSTGIPELKSPDDISWITSRLVLDLDDDQAGEFIQHLIKKALANKRILINDAIHMFKHK